MECFLCARNSESGLQIAFNLIIKSTLSHRNYDPYFQMKKLKTQSNLCDITLLVGEKTGLVRKVCLNLKPSDLNHDSILHFPS